MRALRGDPDQKTAMRAARDAGGSADLDAAERLARAGRALADAASG